MMDGMIKVIDFINTNRDRYITELKEFLAIPSISALPQHAGDLEKCAEWAASEMTRMRATRGGIASASRTDGEPSYGIW